MCKVFFLGISGNKSGRVIKNTLITARAEDIASPPDKGGRHTPWYKILSSSVSSRIKSFNPAVSHYQREHAPNRL